MVYLTPERLVKSPALLGMIDSLYAENKVDRFVIDEVHCVSNWGQDFRKDYLHLDFLKDKYEVQEGQKIGREMDVLMYDLERTYGEKSRITTHVSKDE